MMRVISIPGIGGSDERHWQTRWEQGGELSAVRIQPASWDAPQLDDWLSALDASIHQSEEAPLLLAHSLGCLLVAFWAARRPSAQNAIRGAFLVAPPDPQGPVFPPAASSFRDVPRTLIPFPTLVVASANDLYSGLSATKALAQSWGAGLINAGSLGHINGNSNLEGWELGRNLFAAFAAGTAARQPFA